MDQKTDLAEISLLLDSIIQEMKRRRTEELVMMGDLIKIYLKIKILLKEGYNAHKIRGRKISTNRD